METTLKFYIGSLGSKYDNSLRVNMERSFNSYKEAEEFLKDQYDKIFHSQNMADVIVDDMQLRYVIVSAFEILRPVINRTESEINCLIKREEL